MEAKEDYSVRLQMAEMHDEFIERLSKAYNNERYIEAVWYCYAIFEQRINRLIAKYIDKCNCTADRTDKKSIAISTRITCIKKVIKADYCAFGLLNEDIFKYISEWCDSRNDLVHGLISLNHYRRFDDEFKELAERGVPLVHELYKECSALRNQWYLIDEPEDTFPVTKCRCKTTKCMNVKSI